MRQYDFARAWANDADYDIEGPILILTIEELNEMWIAAMDYELKSTRWAGDGKTMLEAPNFATYLQSKGINTNNNGK